LAFTSKNAVKSLFNQYPEINLNNNKIVCVGQKTAKLFNKHQIKPKYIASSAKKLGEWLVLSNSNKNKIIHFCGNLRREELRSIVSKNQVKYQEITVYNTELTPIKITNAIDGILFLSPSSVKSFLKKNTPDDKIAFCLGETTANEAKTKFNKIIVSKIPTLESSFKTIEKYYGNI
jgi:uroporphyrinogen-III synthase